MSSGDSKDEQGPAGLHPDAPFRRALVVANPIAGRGHGSVVGREVVEGLGRMGVPAELHLTQERGDGRARVRGMDTEIDLVVSVGGDGTLREVLDGVVSPEVVVGAVPMGTANVLSLDLGLPRDVDRALEVMAGGKTTAIDLALANGHLSFLVTGVGLDALAVREVEARRSGPITKLSYVTAGLRALEGYEPPHLKVEIDGEVLPGDFGQVLISNVINYAGVLKLASDRRLDDGLYEVYLFPSGGIVPLFLNALHGVIGHLPGGGVTMQRAREVRVTSEHPVPIQVDGDAKGETPLEFAVTDRQVRLLVP